MYTSSPSSPRLRASPGYLNSQAPQMLLEGGKVDSGSPRALVPQSDTGAGCWTEGTWELMFTESMGTDYLPQVTLSDHLRSVGPIWERKIIMRLLRRIGIRLTEMMHKCKTSRLFLRHSEHSLNDITITLHDGTNAYSGSVAY